ncbi:hypothetical protein [Nesterenkonia natronophila]|uniref:CBS domain-containing protein n=1 Tax=Nesterenkonia natronophila TaxID=2174932 RepID=A0A3A4F3M4_9MICC|nr:hypothetical protein [Nesterenkonia natronophila]RJN32952.1 hypothetical protein D3250_03865 [Nesterenkonia natronophila]
MSTTQAGSPQPPLPPDRATDAQGQRTPSANSTVRDALVPLNGHVLASEGVETALQRMRTAGVEYLVITDPEDGPLSLITREDTEQLQSKHPDLWSAMRCGNVVVAPSRFLQADEGLGAAAEVLKSEGVRPLLVVDGEDIVGALEPTAVFQWCAEHRPAVLDELAQLARDSEPNGQQ